MPTAAASADTSSALETTFTTLVDAGGRFITAVPLSVAETKQVIAGADLLGPALAAAVIVAAVVWFCTRRGDNLHRAAVTAAAAAGFVVNPLVGALGLAGAVAWHLGGRARGKNRSKTSGAIFGVVLAAEVALWTWAQPTGGTTSGGIDTASALNSASNFGRYALIAALIIAAVAAAALLARRFIGDRPDAIDEALLMPGTNGHDTCDDDLRDPNRTFAAALIDDVLMNDQGGRCLFHDEGCTAQVNPADPRNSPTFEGDHLIPWSKGGRTNRANLGALCKRCNSGKGALSETEARAKLRTEIATGNFRGGHGRQPLRRAA